MGRLYYNWYLVSDSDSASSTASRCVGLFSFSSLATLMTSALSLKEILLSGGLMAVGEDASYMTSVDFFT